MLARTPANEQPPHQSPSSHLKHTDEEEDKGVTGNERLTALVSLVLLVLIIVELITSAFLQKTLKATPTYGPW